MMKRVGVVLLLVLSSCGGGGGDDTHDTNADLVTLGSDGSAAISTLAFGTVPLGSAATLTFFVQNQGGGSSGPVTVTTTAPFSVGSDSLCAQSLPPSAACLVSIVFTPTSGGADAETVTIAGSDAETGDSVSLPLTGSGVQSVRGD